MSNCKICDKIFKPKRKSSVTCGSKSCIKANQRLSNNRNYKKKIPEIFISDYWHRVRV